ncbi:MAG: cyclase family protein [Clostridiales bacterium]|nr:cyclase family protein [Clostridiales bacterium]
MAWIDITLPIRAGMAVWPGDPPCEAAPLSRIRDGAGSNVSRFTMSSHCGTHLDAPRHFFDAGETVDQLSPDLLIGPAYVIDLANLSRNIRADDLSRLPGGVTRLLIRTANSLYDVPDRFDPGYIGLTWDAAALLCDRGVMLVGLDAWSVAAMGPDLAAVHRMLLGRPGAAALESIRLRDVREGWYELVCLPLRLDGLDGAPARALVREAAI